MSKGLWKQTCTDSAAWFAIDAKSFCRKIQSLPGQSELDGLVVVLVRPRNPLNIGAAARAMSNFGAHRLRLVNAYAAGFREARSAVGASDLLHQAEEYKTVAEAVADCALVVGTTAVRNRVLQQPVRRLDQNSGTTIRKQLPERAGCAFVWVGKNRAYQSGLQPLSLVAEYSHQPAEHLDESGAGGSGVSLRIGAEHAGEEHDASVSLGGCEARDRGRGRADYGSVAGGAADQRLRETGYGSHVRKKSALARPAFQAGGIRCEAAARYGEADCVEVASGG